MFQCRHGILSGLAFILTLSGLVLFAQPGLAESQSHDGYYYPAPQTEERYRPRVPSSADANRRNRIGFTTGLTAQMLASPSPPRFAIFAKGEEAEKLIIVSITDDAYNTLYRLRALMAMLTAYARSSPAFNGFSNPEDLTFLDMVYLIGFTQVTVSDGRDISHRIYLDPEVK